MNADRAMEILTSTNVIDVTYQNNAIWIEKVDQQKSTAQIKDLKTNKINQVPVTELQELKH